ncbi:MAG TPA: alanyl-tRNA editing protein AlaXM [Thermomicrobiales bacterium]|nr:alanyl-tRNA editing protein AlaXM [Thermomicrobiales bacterium]
MTTLLHLDDSYLRAFDATVTAVIDEGIVLDRTAFYPTGGGQPHDTGALSAGDRQWRVTAVSKRGNDVVHALEPDAEPPAVGTLVHGEIDWDRRYRLMRTHTALHVLCGVVFREFGALVTGGNMGPDKARMDFELEDLSAERVSHIEQAANEVIRDGRAVTWRTLPRAEAFQIPDLIRTKINLLPESISEVRVVEIEGLDLQADGGAHVHNTSEVGGIRVIGTRSKGRINKRLEIELVDEDGVGER